MPVKWLYLTRNGKLMRPTASGGGKDVILTDGATTPTADDPIVGRVAFWTDDETSKININTAGDGAAWDTPMCTTFASQLLGNFAAVATTSDKLGCRSLRIRFCNVSTFPKRVSALSRTSRHHIFISRFGVLRRQCHRSNLSPYLGKQGLGLRKNY
jgi:hypothetical protein